MMIQHIPCKHPLICHVAVESSADIRPISGSVQVGYVSPVIHVEPIVVTPSLNLNANVGGCGAKVNVGGCGGGVNVNASGCGNVNVGGGVDVNVGGCGGVDANVNVGGCGGGVDVNVGGGCGGGVSAGVNVNVDL